MTDDPWFVRTGSGLTTSIRPRALPGWLLTAAYAVAVTLIANVAAHAGQYWLPWAALIVALTGAYLVTIWRLSVFEPRNGGDK
jgi:hypothetical protein